MTDVEARALLDDLESEILDRLPEGTGACLIVWNQETGETWYTSNLRRDVAISLLKQFVNRNTQ